MDILLGFGPRGADLQISANDLTLDDSLYTAVVISLFSDRQAASDEELPARATDRRGWWADATLPKSASGGADKLGSRLWLLAREKQRSEVLVRAEDYAEEALAWLVSEGRVKAVDVTASNPARGLLVLSVRLTLPDDSVAAWTLAYDAAAGTYSTEAAS